MSDVKFKVLWVYQRLTTLGERNVESGQQPSLCMLSGKNMVCVASGHPVRVLKKKAADFDKLRAVMKGEKLYEVQDAVTQFAAIGQRNGITKTAKAILDVAGGTLSADELDIENIKDEEDMTMSEIQAETGETAAPKKTPMKSATKAKAKAGNKAKAKAAAEKPAAKAKGKAAAEKPAKEKKGDGLGREGSLTRFMNERLVKGETNEQISKAAKAKFPKSETTDPSHVSWYRWSAAKKGLIKGKK